MALALKQISCSCGNQMKRVNKKLGDVEIPAQECSSCGRIEWIDTPTNKALRVVGMKPVVKKLSKLSGSVMVILPAAFANALGWEAGREVEIAIEGLNKMVLRGK